MQYKDDLPLGKSTEYVDKYNPALLCAIPRYSGREELGICSDALPFQGVDIWNAYELSWLNSKGKPVVAVAELHVQADSPFMVESKSLKLYLNSFNQTRFNDVSIVFETIKGDLSALLQSNVSVEVRELSGEMMPISKESLPGFCVDELDIEVNDYQLDRRLLKLDPVGGHVSEVLCSNLLRSNCPVTCQPDWGSVVVCYTGEKICRESLLRYIISYRIHNGFHEQCVERMFVDIKTQCQPDSLSIYARYVRRGGLDINPYRSDERVDARNIFTVRQ